MTVESASQLNTTSLSARDDRADNRTKARAIPHRLKHAALQPKEIAALKRCATQNQTTQASSFA